MKRIMGSGHWLAFNIVVLFGTLDQLNRYLQRHPEWVKFINLH